MAESAQEAESLSAFAAFETAHRARLTLRLAFKRVLYAWGKAGGLFLALVTGAREYTEEKLSSLFAAAGLAHVLALSGMHLSIFTGASAKIGKKTGTRAGNAISLFAVLFFVWFAGFTPSLKRAFLCFLLQFCAKLCGKRTNMLSILAAAFVIHSCAFPQEAASVSFMLSYLGLAGILLASHTLLPLIAKAVCKIESLFCRSLNKNEHTLPPRAQKILELLNRPYSYVCSNALAGSGAFITTSPVTARVFGFLTPVSIVSSVIVSPLVTLFILMGICCVILTLAVPQCVFALAKVMNVLYNVMIACVTFFSKIPPITLKQL
jgi:competence protein ComEC